LLQLALIFGIIYFLMIRPKVKQEKQHRERVTQLKKGDEVVTAGGVVGQVIHLKEDRITIKSGESRLIVLRDRVADILSSDAKQETSR
jgi:preprotein translocase subunit YajC